MIPRQKRSWPRSTRRSPTRTDRAGPRRRSGGRRGRCDRRADGLRRVDGRRLAAARLVYAARSWDCPACCTAGAGGSCCSPLASSPGLEALDSQSISRAIVIPGVDGGTSRRLSVAVAPDLALRTSSALPESLPPTSPVPKLCTPSTECNNRPRGLTNPGPWLCGPPVSRNRHHAASHWPR